MNSVRESSMNISAINARPLPIRKPYERTPIPAAATLMTKLRSVYASSAPMNADKEAILRVLSDTIGSDDTSKLKPSYLRGL